MGWVVWDLMRGVDVLLKQPGIDPARIILLGAVAGGGDPAGVTAALDSRIACLVPFNFGGWQPESSVLENPDRDFAWFGEGYWETTRGLRNGARDGFAHYVIVGSIAPRPLIYAHEFAWNANTDPAWPRLQKIYGFYGAKDRLTVAHGAGSVRGEAGPNNTHCTHIGAVHRKMIYPALKQWFDMPVPQEYSNRRTAAELTCWTDAARAELKPKMLCSAIWDPSMLRVLRSLRELEAMKPEARRNHHQREWAKRLGAIEPAADPKLIEGRPEDVPSGRMARFALEVEPGIVVPFLLITPEGVKGKPPVVVMVGQGGKAAFLKNRSDAITAFLKAGVAVCLVDVRGTGETKPGDGSPGRSSSRTSISQTNLILGQTLLGSQLRDLRTVIRWLQSRPNLDGKKLAVWGDSFVPTNPAEPNFGEVGAPGTTLDAPELPPIAEPLGGLLALFAGLYEDGVTVVYTRGGLDGYDSLLREQYLYVPHDAIVPGGMTFCDLPELAGALAPRPLRVEGPVDARNRDDAENYPMNYAWRTYHAYDVEGRFEVRAVPAPADAAAWVVKQLNAK